MNLWLQKGPGMGSWNNQQSTGEWIYLPKSLFMWWLEEDGKFSTEHFFHKVPAAFVAWKRTISNSVPEKFQFNLVNMNPFFILNQLIIGMLWLFIEFLLEVGIF